MDLSAKLAKIRAATAAERSAAESAGQAGVDPASPGAPAAEAPAVNPVEISHRQAIDVAMQDARAEAGLRQLAWDFRSSRNGLSRVLGAVPPENMGSFLRAAADPAIGKQEVEFFQALCRSLSAGREVRRPGATGPPAPAAGDTQAVRMAQSRADVDRVLAGLEKASGQPGRTPGITAVEDLLADIHRARQYTYKALDKLVGARPELQVRIEPDLGDPQWPTYERRAAEYARRHPPEGKPLSAQERQMRAALFQTVERAWAGEYGNLKPAERAQMLELFDAVADAARVDDGWRSSKRGELNEALQLGTDMPSKPTAWVKGERVPRGTSGSSELDHADPPVTDAELRDGSVLTRERTWIERKDYIINSSDQAMSVAREHYKEAVADLGNLPKGSTLAVEYARDYAHLGDPTLRAMADLFYQDRRMCGCPSRGRSFPGADLQGRAVRLSARGMSVG